MEQFREEEKHIGIQPRFKLNIHFDLSGSAQQFLHYYCRKNNQSDDLLSPIVYQKNNDQ